MQHGHMDDFVRSQIESEIAVAKAEQQTALDPAAEPVVTILFTESPHLEMGQQMPLHEADALFARLDAEHRGGGYYDKTDFRIDFTFQGEPHSYSGRQDFGDRDGSLIEHIREYQTFYLNDEKWKDHLTRQGGPEAWAEDHASREAFLTEIIPYMELHCNLSRLEQEAQTRLASSDTLTPEETAYYGALVDYAMECRPLLNHGEPLPEMPKLTDFDQSLQDYKAQVEAEIAQEAADAGMTVEEYAAAGYEAPAQPQEVKEPPQQEAPEQQTKEPAASDYYYSINEGAARRAKEMNSFSDYKPGSATAEYRHYVDVRAGQNYLVEDFTRMERLRSDPVVLESLSRVAQEIGFDRVRPYVVENGSYKAMPDMPFTQWENPYFTVDPPAQEQGDTFTIYQLKGGPETRDYRFEAYESLQEAGLAVDRQNYDLIYTAPLDGKTTLEDIYRTFNLDRPADFTGHSLSVSDVVVLNRSGKEEAHYCDSFGFTPVPEFFLQREKQLTPRELLTGESIQTPRGSFLVTDMSREQLEAAGYGFHHQSEDGKYLIMGNGTDAFAIPAQQESPIKAAEMTTEQNYNMIDGVLNNAPTMSELEAKAKAGEQISLFDVAEAAKAEAQKPKQPQRPAQKQKKPSIRAQLKAAKEEQQKKPPQREKAQELEV